MGALLIYHEVKRFSSRPDDVQTGLKDLAAVGSRHGLAARAWPTMSASVKLARCSRIWFPTSAQTPEQHALALVVAGPVLVGFAEVAGVDRPVDGGDDLGQGDGLGGPGEHVAAPDASLGAHEAHALQAEQDLLEVGLGESGALGEVAHRGGRLRSCREGPGLTARDWRSPPGWILSRRHPIDAPVRSLRSSHGRAVSGTLAL